MSVKIPRASFASVFGVFHFFPHLNVLCFSYSILFLPTPASQCVYVIPEVYQKLQKYSSREEKELLPARVPYTSVQASEIARCF